MGTAVGRGGTLSEGVGVREVTSERTNPASVDRAMARIEGKEGACPRDPSVRSDEGARACRNR